MRVTHSIARSDELLHRLRFMAVGIGGTLLDFTILVLLSRFGLPLLPANTLSTLAGDLNHIYWNHHLTFSDVRGQIWQRQFGYFVAVSLIGLLLSNIVMLLLDAPFAHLFGAWGFLPAKVLATGMVFFWSDSANHFWTFRSPH